MGTYIGDQGISRDDLVHYGILGMHWGIRRYQPYGEGGYDPKKKGKYVGKLNPQQKREYSLSKRENRIKAARATVGAGVAAGALTAAGVFSPASIPLSMFATATVNAGINAVKNHKYKTFLREQNEIHDEQINMGRDYVKNKNERTALGNINAKAADYYDKKYEQTTEKLTKHIDSGKTGIIAYAKTERLSDKQKYYKQAAADNRKLAIERIKQQQQHAMTRNDRELTQKYKNGEITIAQWGEKISDKLYNQLEKDRLVDVIDDETFDEIIKLYGYGK